MALVPDIRRAHATQPDQGSVKRPESLRASIYALRRRRGVYLPGEFRWLVVAAHRSEEHTSELQSLMRISYAVFCLKKKKIGRLNFTHAPLLQISNAYIVYHIKTQLYNTPNTTPII